MSGLFVSLKNRIHSEVALSKLNLFYSYIIRTSLIALPDIPFIMRFRGWLYSFFMRECGKNFQVSSTSVIRGLQNISVGENVYLAPNCYLLSRESIVIEDEVMVAINSVIVDCNHGFNNGSYRFSRGKQKKITIGKGTWIAANCVVTSGVSIGNGCVIGAGCTVQSDIPAYSKLITNEPILYQKHSQ